MSTEDQYKLALYSLPVISLQILILSITVINYYVMQGLLVLSIITLLLSIYGIYNNYTDHYGLIVSTFIIMLLLSLVALNISNIIYDSSVLTTISYIISLIITVLELAVIYLLLNN